MKALIGEIAPSTPRISLDIIAPPLSQSTLSTTSPHSSLSLTHVDACMLNLWKIITRFCVLSHSKSSRSGSRISLTEFSPKRTTGLSRVKAFFSPLGPIGNTNRCLQCPHWSYNQTRGQVDMLEYWSHVKLIQNLCNVGNLDIVTYAGCALQIQTAAGWCNWPVVSG